MKTASDKLFRLIKVLTPTEKRYLKIFMGKEELYAEKYSLLFDAIDKQKEQNEAHLIKIVYKNKRIDGKKFSELKNYLYMTVLRLLQDFDMETSVDYRQKNMLGNIRVLYRRAMYEECADQIYKVQKVAAAHEDFDILIELLRWEKQIAHTKGDINFFSKKLQSVILQEKEYYKILENINFYKNTFYEIYATIRQQGLLGHEKMTKSLAATMAQALMQNEENALSKKAKILYFRSRSIYAYAILDHETFYQESKRLLSLMESYWEYMEEEVSEYISALNNFIASCFPTKRYEEASEMLEKLRQVTPRTADDRVKIHRQYYQSKLQWCIATAAFEEGMEVIAAREKEKKRFEQQDLIHTGFGYPYFYIAFGAAEYERAQDYLNDWLSSSKTVDRQDLQLMARLLSLILHFEMGNNDLLDSLLKSTAYYISRNSAIVDFERLLFRVIREAYHATSKKELIDLLEEIKPKFETLAEDSSQSIFTQYFDFIAWLESKISGRTFAQTMKEKLRIV